MATSPERVAAVMEWFVRTEFRVADGDPMFSRDAHLFEAGFVDSVGFAQIVAFIESTFGVTVDTADLLSEEFTTINGISRVIQAAPTARRTATPELGPPSPATAERE
jgi:acyl carrier protein